MARFILDDDLHVVDAGANLIVNNRQPDLDQLFEFARGQLHRLFPGSI